MLTNSGRFQLLPISVLLFCLIAVSSVAGYYFARYEALYAQSGGVTTSSGNPTSRSLIFEGEVLHLKSRNQGTLAPTVFGILMPPDVEPTHPFYNKGTWRSCVIEGNQLHCKDKININGNIYESMDTVWSLPTTQ